MPLLALGLMVIMMMVEISEEAGRATYAQVQAEAGNGLGANMLVIRNAVEAYLVATPSAIGNIPLNELGLPSWFTPHQAVHALVHDGRAYVYFTPRDSRVSLRELLGAEPPGLIGIARHQQLISPRLNTLIPLPEAIPEDSIVLIL